MSFIERMKVLGVTIGTTWRIIEGELVGVVRDLDITNEKVIWQVGSHEPFAVHHHRFLEFYEPVSDAVPHGT